MLAIKNVFVCVFSYSLTCVSACVYVCLLMFFPFLVYQYNKLNVLVFFFCYVYPRLNVDDHLFVDVGVAHHRAELLEGDFAVLVLVGEHDGLVDNLLQLGVFQVVADHHL